LIVITETDAAHIGWPVWPMMPLITSSSYLFSFSIPW
jgi:hypothetical protein